MKHLILRAVVGIGEGGMACGPVSGPVVAEVKLREDDGSETYFCLAEAMGIPNFYEMDRSTIEAHLDNELSEEEIEELNAGFIETGDYDEIFVNQDEDYYEILRYMIYLVRASDDEAEAFIKNTEGRYLEEIEIPISDVEEEYGPECELCGSHEKVRLIDLGEMTYICAACLEDEYCKCDRCGEYGDPSIVEFHDLADGSCVCDDCFDPEEDEEE